MTLEFQPISEIGHLLLGVPFSGHVDDIVVLDSNEINPFDVRFYVRHGAHVVAFNVSSIGTSINWNKVWHGQLFDDAQRTSYPLKAYPWLVTDTMLDDGSDGVVLRYENGIAFYRLDRKNTNYSAAKIQGLSRDTNFRDLYGWAEMDRSVVLIGRFYRNIRLVGVMSVKKMSKTGPVVQFYAASKERLESRQPHPLFPLRKSPALTDISWMSNATHFYVADMQRNGQDMIIVRKAIQLEIYQFDDAYSLQQVAKVSLVDNTSAGLNDQFFFVNLTGQRLLDIVHFTRHGLFVYQQRSTNGIATLEDYTLINYHSAFSETSGWMSEYDRSIRLVDTDGDGQHDLIFTGPKGLTVLGFNAVKLTWTTLFDPSSFIDSTAQRFAVVVGATKSMAYNGKRESFLLTVDEENRLYLGRFLVKSRLESLVLPAAAPAVHLVPSANRSTAKIPLHVKQMAASAPERRILRWTEQHDEPFSLADIVDPISGSIHFKLPIFKPPSHSDSDAVLPHTISLSYDSQRAAISNLVGLGWALSLPDNYISIDYCNSIFVEDWAFHWTVNGVPFRLEPVSHTGQQLVLFFRQPTVNCDAEFHRKEERWIIQTETETLTYGSEGMVRAVRWNLHWPHWRGSGNDVKSLQRIPVAWYLIQRRIKATGRIFTYRYDIDTVDGTNSSPMSSWTAAIRLKRIESSTTSITFDYAIKQKDEYQSFDHLQTNENNVLVFPVLLRQSHYLTACQITAEDYSQRMEFVYQTDDKHRRLLTAIEQPITAVVRETIFRFNYHYEDAVAGRPLLNEIQLPNGLKVHFQYDKVAVVNLPVSYSSVARPVDEQPAIAYSQAYAVMAFQQRQLPDRIQLKIVAINLIETLAELSAVPAKRQQVHSYDVRAYANYCLVLFNIDGKQRMCLYHHSVHDRVSKWNKDPTCYWIDGLMQSSEAGIALTDTNAVRILELNKDASKWVEHRLKLPFSHVIRLEMFNHLIVGYDDRQLFICHPQRSTEQWQIGNIDKLNDLFSGGSSIVRKFCLPPEMEKILIGTLKTDLLQVSSNMVAIGSLHLDDEQQLLLKVHLYLLDGDFNVVRRRAFTVQGERILQLRNHVLHQGTTYQLAYHLTKESFFQLRVVRVSGELVKEMLSKMTQDVNAQETEWKKKVTSQRYSDFKAYAEEQQEQFEEWQKMATGKKTPVKTTSKPLTCDDASYAPCNRYCHQMEALSKNHKATLDQAIQVRKDWDECHAKNWKKIWEENMTMTVTELTKSTETQRNKIAQLQSEWNKNGIDITSGEKVSQDTLSSINDGEGFKQLFSQSFLINWSLHRILMTPQGLQAGNATLIQMTGDDWHLQKLAASKVTDNENKPFSVSLGTSFILEETVVDHQSEIRKWTLYAQDARGGESREKTGPPLHQLVASSPDSLISRYPVYLAYQARTNDTVVIFFSDNGQTIGEIHTFPHEQLMMGVSSYQQVATLATKHHYTERMEFVVRSLGSITNSSGQKLSVVKRIKTSNNDASLRRYTGYEWADDGKGNVTVIIVPGNNRKLAGWMKQTWTAGQKPSAGWTQSALEMFDADGHKVRHAKKQNDEDSDDSETSDSIAWDAEKQRIISDFSPYKLRHQMVSYYGFERYEVNNSSSTTRWRFRKSDVVEGEFSLTGSNHLRLKSNNSDSILEGVFLPAQQDINYVASCWIRYSDGVNSLASTTETNQITSHFKAIVNVGDIKVVALLGRIMRKVADWSYVEVIIDFDTVRQLCNENGITLKQDNEFTIKLKVEAGRQDGQQSDLDVDHIRFTPMTHDFNATVYHVKSGQPISIIGSSGSISRTVYYRDRQMAVITDVTIGDGRQQFEQIATSSLTGRLLPKPTSIIGTQPPCRIVFYPQDGGLYEHFDAYAWRNRWNDPQSDPSAWTIAPGRLLHNHQQPHRLVSQDASVLFGIDSSSAAIRCYYSLISSTASVTWKLPLGDIQLGRKSNEMFKTTLTLIQSQHGNVANILTHLPNDGELIVLVEGKRFFVWIDSILLMDVVLPAHIAWSSLTFEAQGDCFIDDCIFIANPRVEMEYLNEWADKMQTIQLESDTSVLVSQTLYDALGRPAIATKVTRITSDGRKPLLAYYRDFVDGPIDPSHPLSVWQSHRLRGQVDRANSLDRGVAYSRVQYAANPLNEKCIEGQAGPEFTINGPFAKKFRTSYNAKDNIDVIDNHFPTDRGFRHKVEELANGTRKVAVFDENGNRVALYIYVPGYDHLLSTYEYDTKNRLIKILPPMYHAQAETLNKSDPLLSHQLSADELRWQQSYATLMSYADDTDRLLSKTTSDAGTFNYYYNSAGQIRLEVHSSWQDGGKFDSVVFYSYEDTTVTRTGYLEDMPMSREHFRASLANGTLMNANNYQLIDRTDAKHRHYDASFLRGERNATFATLNLNYNVVEKMRWDGHDRLVEFKRTAGQIDWQMRKRYYSHSKRLRTIDYPTIDAEQPIRLQHRYNKLGQLIELNVDGQEDAVVRFSYHASGQLAGEYFHPGSHHAFNRTFDYNSPGYLERISDRYLAESIFYTQGDYGQSGYGDGIVMKTRFNATWSPNADWRWFQVTDSSKFGFQSHTSAQLCFNTLKRKGYMTKTGRPLKDYHYPFSGDGQSWMPLVCGGRNGQQLAKVLAQKRMPRIYGHRYAYGHHQELVKAKYFTDETETMAVPFQPDTLANQTGLNRQQSRDIWKKLDSAGFIVTDQRNFDWLAAIANPAKPLLRNSDLKLILQSAGTADDDMTRYQHLIETMILNDIGLGRSKLVDVHEFQQMVLQWKGIDDGLSLVNVNQSKQVIGNVHRLLNEANNLAWLDAKLADIFRPADYSSFMSDVIGIMCQRFAHGLGEHPFDVASYDIDANGNHRKFYTGYNRYTLAYNEEKPNQIRSVRMQDANEMQMLHDSQGNVVQALHKAIQRIEYNTASKRTTAIHLTDGRVVRFAYDGHGERTFKQVLAKDGQVMLETHYVRDEGGRVLFDSRTTFSQGMTSTLTTAYIYGPRGLVGFMRNGSFHSVWTDHSGSIRLVLRDGQVVAAYDYLPYGQAMRAYGSDPAAAISYRYTGQEWDDETGLYNYHARLYDPDIGRFYQPDPRSQYFSPYNYVGNSPVSLVDPDGEFALLVALIAMFATAGAYLGGAAANDNWNPAQWDYKSGKTWMGIIGGGIGGAIIPVSGGLTVATIGLPATIAAATTAAYVAAAAANGNWDPSKWAFDRPSTYNALFQGVGTALGITGGAIVAHRFASQVGTMAKSLTVAQRFASQVGTTAKSLILIGTYGTAAGFAYGRGVHANDGQLNPFKWDFTNPATFNALLEGADMGIGLPTDLTQIVQGISKLATKIPKHLAANLKRMKHLKPWQKAIVMANKSKGRLSKLAASAVTAYLMTSLANDDFDPRGWDGSSFSTYEQFLNGLTLGVSVRNMLKAGKKHLGGSSIRKRGQRIKLEVAETRLAIKQAFNSIRSGKIQKWIKTKLIEVNIMSPKLLLATGGLSPQFSAKHPGGRKMLNVADQQLPSNQLADIRDSTNQIRKRKYEVFIDGGIGCGTRRVRRRKRGAEHSKPCLQILPDIEKQMKFKDDPVDFLINTAISTRNMDKINYSEGRRISIVNGNKYQFQLLPGDGPGYHLKIQPAALKDVNTIEGYWLNTDDKIHINPLDETRFIFTGELQGCSIHVKYNYNNRAEPQMTVYHHRRVFPETICFKDGQFVTQRSEKIAELDGAQQLFDANGNVLRMERGEITPLENIYRKDDSGQLQLVMKNAVDKNRRFQKIEDDLSAEYDIAIRYEDYYPSKSNYQLEMLNQGLPLMFSTAILYRHPDNNQWYFISQKIAYKSAINTADFDLSNVMLGQRLVDQMASGKPDALQDFLSQQWDNDAFNNVLYVKQLITIPTSSSEVDYIAKTVFVTPQDFRNRMRAKHADVHSTSEWQNQVSTNVDVRDLEGAGKGRSRRSLLQHTRNMTYQLKCHRQSHDIYHNDSQPSVDPPSFIISSGSRPHSWIHFMSLKSIASIVSFDSIFELLTVSPMANLSQKHHHQPQLALDLPQPSVSNKTDYRDATIGNCYTFSADGAVVCYGYGGRTLVFVQSPSAEDSPLPLQQHQDTFRQCRPIDWFGKPSVTCQGDDTTFMHTPYETTSAAANYFNAIDGWLLLTYAAPGFYRQIGKCIGHIRNVWAGSPTVSQPIGKESKQSWQKQLQQVDLLVAKCESHHVKWAKPLVEELRQQIGSLMNKSNVKTMDEVRTVKTMTERLTALIEDVGELADFGTDDEEDLVFYDCFEESPAKGEPKFNESNNFSAESMSARLHQLTCHFKEYLESKFSSMH